MSNLRKIIIVSCLIVSLFSAPSFATTKEVVKAGEGRLKQNQDAQNKVSGIHEQTQDLVESYQALVKVVDGLEVYNKILAKQLSNQDREVEALNRSISDAAVIERQILPLLTRMLDGLEQFIALDIPFLVKEREQRLDDLKKLISRSELTNAEKTRRVFEAFQIENEFGNTIESYKGKLDFRGKTYDVDYLRVGRVSFTYRSVGSGDYGYWDTIQQKWMPLEDTKFKRNIDKGIKMAKQELAPELFTVPLVNTGGQ